MSINTKINLQTNFKNAQGHIPGLHFRATMMVQHMQNRIYKDTRMLFRTHDHLDVYGKSHQQPIMKKALKKLQIEGTYLNIMKATQCKPNVNIIINEEK